MRRREALGVLAAAITANADPLGIPIGVQLYTVGAEIRKDRDATLAAIAKIGYGQVQLATGLATDPRELVRAVHAAGLKCSSTHYALADLLRDLGQKIETCMKAGLSSIVCSFPWIRDTSRLDAKPGDQMAMAKAVFAAITLDDWKWTAGELNRIGAEMTKAGIEFGYHNHNLDFRRFGEVQAFEELMRLTDPKLVKLELDCGWATVAGEDPAKLIAKYANRTTLLHIKDQVPQNGPSFGADGFGRCTSVGAGIVNWKAVFAAARKAGVRGYYVEQEPPFQVSPLESIAQSYTYLHGLK